MRRKRGRGGCSATSGRLCLATIRKFLRGGLRRGSLREVMVPGYLQPKKVLHFFLGLVGVGLLTGGGSSTQ